MTTSTMKPGTGAPVQETDRDRRHDLAVFAAVVVAVLGLFNLLDGIAAINRSHVFVDGAQYVVGDLYSWGWVMAILGGLQLLTSAGVLFGVEIARWSAVAFVALNAIGQMFFATAFPLWSLLIIVIDIVAIYALCAYAGPRKKT